MLKYKIQYPEININTLLIKLRERERFQSLSDTIDQNREIKICQ
jgi:hypothetical protein